MLKIKIANGKVQINLKYARPPKVSEWNLYRTIAASIFFMELLALLELLYIPQIKSIGNTALMYYQLQPCLN